MTVAGPFICIRLRRSALSSYIKPWHRFKLIILSRMFYGGYARLQRTHRCSEPSCCLPLHSKIGETNYVPDKDESIAIQKLIDEVEPHIASLADEIEALKQKKALYTSFVENHRALLSLIRRMPPDILRNIFSHCIPLDTPDKSMRSSQAPLLLAQICGHWRDLTIQAPILWSTIFAQVPAPKMAQSIDLGFSIAPHDAPLASFADEWHRKMESFFSLITLWLSRSGGLCPLTIVFRDMESYRHNPEITQEPMSRLLSLLCSRSSQWAELDLRIAESSPGEEAFLSLSPSLVPRLQALRVAWQPCQFPFGWDSYQIPATRTAPPLHLMTAARARSLFGRLQYQISKQRHPRHMEQSD
jgi:F-box-like